MSEATYEWFVAKMDRGLYQYRIALYRDAEGKRQLVDTNYHDTLPFARLWAKRRAKRDRRERRNGGYYARGTT